MKIFEAAGYGDEDRITALLRNANCNDCKKELLLARDNTGASPLIEASRWGQTECINILLGAGYKDEQLMARDNEDNTPLMMAVESGVVENISILLDAGCKEQQIQAENIEGYTPLMFAATFHRFNRHPDHYSDKCDETGNTDDEDDLYIRYDDDSRMDCLLILLNEGNLEGQNLEEAFRLLLQWQSKVPTHKKGRCIMRMWELGNKTFNLDDDWYWPFGRPE